MQQIQSGSAEFGCANLHARFEAPYISETLVELTVPAAEIDGLDILLTAFFRMSRKRKIPGEKVLQAES
jgi:hypothetical protein